MGECQGSRTGRTQCILQDARAAVRGDGHLILFLGFSVLRFGFR
jgi:hypothetical protein